MTTVAYRKKVWKRRKRRLVPHARIFKVKSLIPKRTVYIHKGHFRLFKHRTQRARLFRRFNLWVIPKHQKPFKQHYTPPKKPTISKEVWAAKKKDWGAVWKSTAYKKYKPKPQVSGFPKALKDWAQEQEFFKEQFGREKLKTRQKAKKTFKKIERRGGKRKYVWKGEYYGVKKALGPKLIFEVFPTHKYYMYIRARKSYGDHMIVIKSIRKSMQKVIDDLTKYAEKVIKKYVPKETGDLRKAMIDSIKNSKVRGMTLKVELDTGNLKYANWVNNMPEDKIRHDAVNKQIGRRSGKFLHDPKAVEGWFQMIDMQLNTEAKKLLQIMTADIMAAFSFRYFKKRAKLQPKAPTTKTYVTTKTKKELHTFWTKDKLAEYYNESMNKKGFMKEPEYYIDYEYRDVKYKEKRTVNIKGTVEDLEMERHKRMMKYRQDTIKATKESRMVYYPRDLIKKMFKIRGLNKR